MTRIDRYILTLYARVLVICFSSVTGLLIVVQILTNLDEFVRYAEHSHRTLLSSLIEYFSPFAVVIFEKLSGMLALLAMLFVIAWLNKTNELTALLAAGVTKRRIIRPLLIASFALIAVAAASRELILPRYQDQLTKNPQDLAGNPRPIRPLYDPDPMVLFQGQHLVTATAEIIGPNLKIYGGPLFTALGNKLTAERAQWTAATSEHPAGFILQNVETPSNVVALPSVYTADQTPLLRTPTDASWLAPDSCFLASSVNIEMLRGGSTWKQFASTGELVHFVKGETAVNSRDVRVQIHQRLLRPLSDWTVLLLGIPVLLKRPDRHMFWVAGVCLGIVAGFTAVSMGLSTLGSSGQLVSPALSIWLPLLLFLPWGWAQTAKAMTT
tara:strand:+ start:260 stop:1408 length:1149 start_codon:yes stop_codon:yes gene_type:complete